MLVVSVVEIAWEMERDIWSQREKDERGKKMNERGKKNKTRGKKNIHFGAG